MKTVLDLMLMSETANSTVSALWHENKFICFIIEDGHREIKVPGQTRIPKGIYPVKKRTWGGFFGKYSGKYGHTFVLEVGNVSTHRDILFHIGNKPKDTRGCLLTNDSITFDQPSVEFVGVSSEIAYRKFYTYMSPLMEGEVFLSVHR